MKPAWLKQTINATSTGKLVRDTTKFLNLHTICIEAKCPNRNFCFNRGSLTFLLMGDVCTRNCSFCSVKKGAPEPVDPGEAERIAEACKRIGLRYIVLTSVTRDDLPDGGASHFASVARAVKNAIPDIKIEVLVPDFMGNHRLADIVLDSPIDIFGHNLETVPRLYPFLRNKASYSRSLELLYYASKRGAVTKTGIMVGCGETKEEVFSLIDDIKMAGVKYITIGQYLQPSEKQLPVQRFVSPSEFEEFARYARKQGINAFSHPLARSSFLADLYEHNEILEYGK